jgi:hypothetical protein
MNRKAEKITGVKSLKVIKNQHKKWGNGGIQWTLRNLMMAQGLY